jgi:hypothetical protein
MDERRLTKEIYEADLDGKVVKRRDRRRFLDQTEQFWKKARSRVPDTGERV